jgi:hypothetical protein
MTYLTGSTNEGLYYYNSGSTPGWRQVADTTFVSASLSGSAGYVPVFTGANSVSSSVIFQSGSNIGIGTTSPLHKLDVEGALRIVTTPSAGNIVRPDNIGAAFQFGNGVNTAYGEFRFKDGGGTDLARIFANGNLAIGTTTNAGFKLDVNGTARVNTLNIGLGNSQLAENTVYGFESGNAITTGNFNTLMGYQAGRALTTGQENVFIGRYAGRVATTSNQNVAIGQAAGFALTTGIGNNVLIGLGSGLAINTGHNNVAVGSQSLATTTTGSQNTAVGVKALNLNVSSYNTALGYNSGANISGGQQQVVIGYESLGNNTTGDFNISIGSQAGRFTNVGNLTSSSSSIFIGYLSKALGDSQTNQIVIGDQAIGAGSNTATLGNTSIVDTILRGRVNLQQYATGSRPTYVKGALIFDSTLNKLVVGGALGWEVVTSI